MPSKEYRCRLPTTKIKPYEEHWLADPQVAPYYKGLKEDKTGIEIFTP
jgi:hypothetical protein